MRVYDLKVHEERSWKSDMAQGGLLLKRSKGFDCKEDSRKIDGLYS